MLLTDILGRFWHEILARPSGPLAFRLVLQPLMAVYLASRDGWHDAKDNRTPYLWTITGMTRSTAARACAKG